MHVFVGVAVPSTPLATTALHVPLGFWGGGALQLRAPGQNLPGSRVLANAMFRDFDSVGPNPRDQRRLEILADGLPQLAVDTTLV